MSPKFIFITGGVLSSLGKGLLSASIGTLLEGQGVSVGMLKFDPYLNVDPRDDESFPAWRGVRDRRWCRD